MRRWGKAGTVAGALGMLGVSVGLVVASVPLYRLVCDVTGLGGSTNVATKAPDEKSERIVTVRFDANIARDLPWRFEPMQPEIKVQLGEQALVFFKATNLSAAPVHGTATFNVTPHKVGQYFSKIECFCFTEQVLQPGETVEMPVSFYVDPKLALDEFTNEVRTLTLSYTFFRAKGDTRS
jgi:cytochrome c oxidase assembly protein subunit 11